MTERLRITVTGNRALDSVSCIPNGPARASQIDTQQAELSYQLLPDYHGRGIAYAAVGLAIKACESNIVAETQLNNTKSRRLLARLGFSEVKILTRYGESQAYYQRTCSKADAKP